MFLSDGGEGVEAEEADGGRAGGEGSGAMEGIGIVVIGFLRLCHRGAGPRGARRARNLGRERAEGAKSAGRKSLSKIQVRVESGSGMTLGWIRNGHGRGDRDGSASSSGWRDGGTSGISYALGGEWGKAGAFSEPPMILFGDFLWIPHYFLTSFCVASHSRPASNRPVRVALWISCPGRNNL